MMDTSRGTGNSDGESGAPAMREAPGPIGRLLRESRTAKVLEIIVVALVACVTVIVGWALVGEDAFARQAVVWVANVLMLGLIWLGLRLRGETWARFGLGFRFGGGRALLKAVLQAIIVLVVALVAFVVGSILMAGLTPTTGNADMSGYEYLQGNLPMLLLALGAVYIVSSFGEEAVYRGFLMNRVAELGAGGRGSWILAVVVSSIAFGLVHFSWGLTGIVQTTLMGFALAVSYLVVKRNLWVLVLAHACIDSLLLIQLYTGAPPAG